MLIGSGLVASKVSASSSFKMVAIVVGLSAFMWSVLFGSFIHGAELLWFVIPFVGGGLYATFRWMGDSLMASTTRYF